MTHAEYTQRVEWLKQYRYLLRERERLKEQKARWKSNAEKVTPNYSLAPGGASTGGGALLRAIEEIGLLDAELTENLRACVRELRKIERAINRIPKPVYRDVLRYRYIEGCRWTEVADKIGYSERQTTRYHTASIMAIKMS